MQLETIGSVLARRDWGAGVTAAGWVRTRRDSKGGFSFVELNDGSCFGSLQVVVDQGLSNYDSEVKQLFPGSAIRVSGKLVQSPGSGQDVEVHADSIHVYGFCDPTTYPLQKQRVSFERLREIAHLRARTNTFGAVTRVRNALAYATHRFFQDRGFHYVNTPIITGSDCEGAGEMFQVTSLDLDAAPRDDSGKTDYREDFFGKRAGLTVSGQLEGETYACALGRIYTFGPTFRAENSNTSRHLAEFWMIEPEIAFADLSDDADLAEEYLRDLFRYVLEHCGEDLAFFNQRIDQTVIRTLTDIAESSFVRLSYTEAIERLEQSGRKFEFPVSWGADLQSEHERFLTEKLFRSIVTGLVLGNVNLTKASYLRMSSLPAIMSLYFLVFLSSS